MKSQTSLEMGHVRSKTRSQGQGATFSNRQSQNLVRTFVLMKSRSNMKIGHVRSKTRSLGQILEQEWQIVAKYARLIPSCNHP